MLKSYKKLDRWYGPLDPEGTDPSPDRADDSAENTTASADGTGPARYPDYIPADEIDPEDIAAPSGRTRSADSAAELTELSGRRSGFTGGWSDWVTDSESGSADDGDLVPFPWTDSGESPARIGRADRRSSGADSKARRRPSRKVSVHSLGNACTKITPE